MKYISLKQQSLDAALLHCIANKFQKAGYEIQYELDYEKEIRFSMNLDFLDANVLTEFQEQANELMNILWLNVLPFPDKSSIRKLIVKEYMEYPGKRKPYYATIFIDKNTKIDLLHVHYYQSSDNSGSRQPVFESNDTIYYDVKKGHIVCHPIKISENDDSIHPEFWVFANTYLEKNVFPSGIRVTLQSTNQKPEKFMSYYKLLKANQDSTDKQNNDKAEK